MKAVTARDEGDHASAMPLEKGLPRISICIPTYNRSSLLDQSLNRLQHAVASCREPEAFEVCVNDNGSSDDTAVVIAKYQAGMARFSAGRHVRNLGFCENLKSVVSLANGEWVVVFGDDDIVLEETLLLLLAWRNAPQALLVFNTAKGERFEAGALRGRRSAVLAGCEQILEELGIYQLSSIANFMVRRRDLIDCFSSMSTQSAYPHSQALYRIAAAGPTLFVNAPLLLAEGHHRDWNVLAPVLAAVDMARVLSEGPLVSGTSYRLRIRCHLLLLRNLPRAILLLRNGNLRFEPTNPYRSLTLSNIVQIYSSSLPVLALALVCFAAFRYTPFKVSILALRLLGRPADFPPLGAYARSSLDVEG